MLPKDKRLSRPQFLDVKKRGTVFFDPALTAVILKTTENPRVSIVVSTKISKSAVVRNRIRRKIYRFFLYDHLLSANLIIYPKKTILSLDDEKITTAINSFISKISLT